MDRAAKTGDPEAIHDLRVAIRRLSRCLRAFSQFYPGHEWRQIRKQLRGLMKLAEEARDRDVALELLAKAGLSPRSVTTRRLQTDRHHAMHDLLVEVRRWKGHDFSRKWRSRLEL